MSGMLLENGTTFGYMILLCKNPPSTSQRHEPLRSEFRPQIRESIVVVVEPKNLQALELWACEELVDFGVWNLVQPVFRTERNPYTSQLVRCETGQDCQHAGGSHWNDFKAGSTESDRGHANKWRIPRTLPTIRKFFRRAGNELDKVPVGTIVPSVAKTSISRAGRLAKMWLEMSQSRASGAQDWKTSIQEEVPRYGLLWVRVNVAFNASQVDAFIGKPNEIRRMERGQSEGDERRGIYCGAAIGSKRARRRLFEMDRPSAQKRRPEPGPRLPVGNLALTAKCVSTRDPDGQNE
ncbi:hypothetical protein FB45DRAFT_876546 [Roridomyces roridus]|uniref:Uncharacterized protein n=1 Tax=Roridomyces roridus TaxID=1738132 RepID=A0AAD7F8U6_9AGAR|nr:hypothetical protein FB45DRAFT_876546 [Roridomyces roridus]